MQFQSNVVNGGDDLTVCEWFIMSDIVPPASDCDASQHQLLSNEAAIDDRTVKRRRVSDDVERHQPAPLLTADAIHRHFMDFRPFRVRCASPLLLSCQPATEPDSDLENVDNDNQLLCSLLVSFIFADFFL